jgi:hypothetical protein
LCQQHGVTLLVVPDTVARVDMREHVREQLIRLKFLIEAASERSSQGQASESETA